MAATDFSFLRILLIVAMLSGFHDVTITGKILDGAAESFISTTVPTSEFEGLVRSSIDSVREIISVVSNFSGGGSSSSSTTTSTSDDLRLSNAVADCVELMELSADQLSSTLSAIPNPNGKYNTRNIHDNMMMWLDGAVVNDDTCREGLEGTNSTLKTLITSRLDKVTSLLNQIISSVKPIPSPTTLAITNVSDRNAINQFPEWLKSHDQKRLQDANVTLADVVVAADGTGKFTSISDAIRASPDYSSKIYIIYVKKGVYKEYIEIGKKKSNIMLIGEGINATIVSGNRNWVDGWTTYSSGTFSVKGQGFIARDVMFENTAGPEKKQAVAFMSESDRTVLYRCAFRGYQDTLYARALRQFYRECKITGTVDFIFGHGMVVFQACEVLARQALPGQQNTITAQGREKLDRNSGFSLHLCSISVEPGVTTKTYLGRPWKEYSRTVIMKSYISGAIQPEGWLLWNNSDFALDTLYYGEYMNNGPGAKLGGRVKWPGYHVITNPVQASVFTVAKFIDGDSWLPSTGVNYTGGLG